jgi:hypothetical protein
MKMMKKGEKIGVDDLPLDTINLQDSMVLI